MPGLQGCLVTEFIQARTAWNDMLEFFAQHLEGRATESGR
jgi:hypothetical protein